MCTFVHNPKLKKPKKEEVTVYKVFGYWEQHDEKPFPFVSVIGFKFGCNKWNKAVGKYTRQSGFQVFAKLKDAERYCTSVDIICPITIKTKDIVSMTDEWFQADGRCSVVYEVKTFNLSEKDWDKAIAEAKKKEETN